MTLNKQKRLKKKEDLNNSGFILDIEFKSLKVKIIYGIIFTLFMLLSLVFIVPILWIVLSAFKDTQEFLKIPPSLFPESIKLAKVAEVWNTTGIGKTYACTFIMVAGELAFFLISNGLAGYVLSRLKPKGTKLILTLVLWTMMMPTNLGMVPRFMQFIDVPLIHANLTDTYVPMWIMAGARAFYAILFKNFFDGIPASYIEAAKIDGGTEIGIFAKIILPLSKPIIMTTSIFCITEGWGTFLWPYLLIKNELLQPIGVKVYTMQNMLSIDRYLMMLIFVIVPPVIVFFFLQKYIMQGVGGGGVKG